MPSSEFQTALERIRTLEGQVETLANENSALRQRNSELEAALRLMRNRETRDIVVEETHGI